MLLSHTSSLAEGSKYNDFLAATYADTPPEVSQLLIPNGLYYNEDTWSSHKPGTFFQYSNINFGLLGTLIEAISGQRFDIYMREHVLAPLSIAGSFNIADIKDINQVAVLYRDDTPQVDNYQGVKPAPRSLENYKIGTNGFIFGAQGGLRISASDLSKILKLVQNNGTLDGITIISPNAAKQMIARFWVYNGTNGEDDGGLFQSWGLGTQRITGQPGKDIIFPEMKMYGHAGDAYGLISDLFQDPISGMGLIFITNGYHKDHPYRKGGHSAFYIMEEEAFAVIQKYSLPRCLSQL